MHKDNEYNIGWMLLRPLICFEVILEHFWVMGDSVPSWQGPFDYMLSMSVPIFIFMAFFFGERHITANEPGYLRKRGRRIVWPLIGWALIYAAVLVPLHWLRGDGNLPGVDDLLWQSVTGHSKALNPSMWYQSVLLLLTLAFFYTFRKPTKRDAMVLLALLCGAIVLEYSGLNYYMFGNLRFELKYPLGRVVEMIPFAVLGYACARYSLLERFALGSLPAILLFIAIAVAAMIPLHNDKNFGFGYGNIFYIPAAIGIALAVWYIPFPRLGPKTMRALRFLTSFTLGIYCIHRLVMTIIKMAVRHGLLPGLDTFYLCVLTYIVSFITCWLISRIPWKHAGLLVK